MLHRDYRRAATLLRWPSPPFQVRKEVITGFFFIQLTRQERCGMAVNMYYLKNARPFHAPQLRQRISRADEAKLSQLGERAMQRSGSSPELACVWWGKSNLIIWDWKEIQSDCFEIKNTGGRSARCKGQLELTVCGWVWTPNEISTAAKHTELTSVHWGL